MTTALLDDKDLISALDKSGMLRVVESAPTQILDTYKASISVDVKKSYDGIVFAGMGGSAIAGDIVSNLFYDSIKKSIYVNRGYFLPAGLSSNSLFIAISYSGETEETLSSLKEAETRGMAIVCISSGGKLKEIAMAKKYPLVDLPSGYQPRAAFYVIFTTIIKVLESLGVIPDQKEPIQEASKVLEMQKGEIGLSRSERTNDAKQLAQKLKDKIPLIISTSGLTEASGLRIKNQFNENSKIAAFSTVFPELNHNEMVGFAALKKGQHNFAAILLRDDEENVRVNKRIEITKSLIGANLGGIAEIKSRGVSRLAKLLSLVFYGDLLSCYVALLRGVDPTPVDIITRLKKELKR